jgi:hypothetical protein
MRYEVYPDAEGGAWALVSGFPTRRRDVDLFQNVETRERRIHINIADDARHAALISSLNELNDEQVGTLMSLAEAWHGTAEELVEAAKELTR